MEKLSKSYRKMLAEVKQYSSPNKDALKRALFDLEFEVKENCYAERGITKEEALKLIASIRSKLTAAKYLEEAAALF